MLRKTDFYINGKWIAPAVAKELDVINPADEQAFAVISLGSAADVDKAVSAARKAFAALRAGKSGWHGSSGCSSSMNRVSPTWPRPYHPRWGHRSRWLWTNRRLRELAI
jgi:hypothetical protein